MAVRFAVRGEVEDDALSELHARAFGSASPSRISWRRRLEQHSLTWVLALDGDRLVGFVNVAWDGGGHAFLLDTAVDPSHRGRGVGRELVRRAAREATEAGCAWLHVDDEADLTRFSLHACGFSPTSAGVPRLR